MTVTVENHVDPAGYREGLAADVLAGLTSEPKSLPPKYFYDARGSDLFDQITRLPEYYPSRTEGAILRSRAEEIAVLTHADTLVELGSGTSEKTRILLDALSARGTLRRFVPFDVDPTVLAAASQAVAGEYPRLHVQAVVGDLEHHLGTLPRHGRRLVAFLGSTIGNFPPDARAELLRELRATLGPGDAFLLGVDLVKATDRLVAAYDDTAGVTAAFNRNVLAVVNRELGADFDPDAFDHVARWNPEHEWIEMRLRSRRSGVVHVRGLDLDFALGRGEEILTEISAKFRPERVAGELAAAGLLPLRWWTDPDGDFALSLSIPA